LPSSLSPLDRAERLLARSGEVVASQWLKLLGAVGRGAVLYALIGAIVTSLGVVGWVRHWSDFGLGSGGASTSWWQIALEGLVAVLLGAVVLLGAALLAGGRRGRTTRRLLLFACLGLALVLIASIIALVAFVPSSWTVVALIFAAFPLVVVLGGGRLRQARRGARS
jgi:NADH:ubiquinone oxidoreductase subunit K